METIRTGNQKWRRTWWIWTFYVFGLLLLISSANGAVNPKNPPNGVQIKRLTVPHSIENGTVEYADLDCDYQLKGNLTELLEVTWIHNDHKIVYKWIPSHNSRKTYGVLEDRIDLDFTLSNIPWEKYRGFRILKPTTEVSGKYTCDVSTKEGHKTEDSMLIVYSKPTEFEFELSPNEVEGQVNISCWASRTYPEPKLTISYQLNKNRIKLTDVNEESSWSSGAYDVRVFSLLNQTSLPSSTIFTCDIKIPNTSYLSRKEIPYKGRRRILADGTEEDESHGFKVELPGITMLLMLFLTINYMAQT